ncbi:MAG: 2OG-Fe(II) oxygenase [Sphingomonadales bacterium]|nr:2OG-Fe(II) oxygenase [Sphingomonadales bacterium]
MLSDAHGVAETLSGVAGIRRTPSALLTQFTLPRFLPGDECGRLCALIDSNVRPSTIADDIGDAAFRTSSTCDLDHGDPLVADIDGRLCALLGIDGKFGEPLQGQRYDVGEEFKFHTDYFEPGGAGYIEHCTVSGQRTWTAMVYLNEPQAGGGTRFKSTGKIVKPETGKLVAWDNITADGFVNAHTLHHGMPVRRGRKYIITKWFRERPWPWPEDARET